MKIELLTNVNLKLLKGLVAIEKEAFGESGLNEWNLVPFIRHGRVFVASELSEPIGVIQYMRDWNNPQKAYLFGVSISKKKRDQGLGTKLIQSSLKILKQENISEVELTVAPDNRAAIRIYAEKLGFILREKRVDEYGQGEDRLVMIVSLESLK